MDKDVKRGFKFAMGRDIYKLTKFLIGFVVFILLAILLSIIKVFGE